MKIEKTHIAAIALVLICLIAVAVLYTTIQEPEISIKDVSLTDVGLSEVSLEFTIEIHNPNFFGAELQSVDYEVEYIDSNNEPQKIGSGIIHDVSIGADETIKLSAPVDIDVKEIPNLAITILKNDNVKFRISGIGMFNILGVGIGVPFVQEETITKEEIGKLTKSALSKIIGPLLDLAL